MKLIVGVGNPQEQYINSRHNLGFKVIDEFIKKMDYGRWKIIGVEGRNWKLEKRFKSAIIRVGDLLFVKPQTLMNNSGLAVKLLATYYKSITLAYKTLPSVGAEGKLPAENIIVIHDELDLPLGKIKIRMGGAAAGHHGVESIIEHLGTDNFIRVRLGIGPLSGHSAMSSEFLSGQHFVLEPFMPSEKHVVRRMIKKAIEALQLLLDQGLEAAQNQYN